MKRNQEMSLLVVFAMLVVSTTSAILHVTTHDLAVAHWMEWVLQRLKASV